MKRRAEASRRYPVPNPMQKPSRKVRIVEDSAAMEIDLQNRRKEVRTVGEAFRASGKVGSQVYHFRAVEVNGVQVKLGDTALITPGEDEGIEKLHVAIIKDITQDIKTGKVMAKVQWFYRPEQAKKEGGGSWHKEDSRLLCYSFQYDNIAAESVMHPCIVHFIPWYKGLPDYRKHPGFVVKNLYDFNKKKLVKLTDLTAEDDKRDEIDLLLSKTKERLGDLPDSRGEDMSHFYKQKVEATKTLLRDKREISRMRVLPENEGPSEYHTILLKSDALTSEEPRNKWLEKILQALERACTEGGNQLTWPDSAVAAAAALEKACKETRQNLSKYNLKMRSLEFNLQEIYYSKCADLLVREKNIVLARRFLKQEFGPSILLEMDAVAMKEGLTPEELARNQREEPQPIQMTDARCRICTQRKVGIVSMARAGCMDRYRLECQVCGRSWYASRDKFSIVATNRPNSQNSRHLKGKTSSDAPKLPKADETR